jgi:hypothetical protein
MAESHDRGKLYLMAAGKQRVRTEGDKMCPSQVYPQ